MIEDIHSKFGCLLHYGSHSSGRKHDTLTNGSSNLKITFKLRKVDICCPWMDACIFQYSSIGIKGLKACSWSTGECDAKNNYGTSPLLPTQFIVARDVEISAEKDDLRLAAIFRSAVESSAEKLGHLGKNVMMVI